MDRFISINEVIKVMKDKKYKEFHIHHTWKPAHKSFNGSNHQKIQDGMRNYHVKVNGWSDIGQHLTLFPDGKLLTGRDFGRNPVSIANYNTGALAIEMVGNFDKPGTGSYNTLGYDRLEGEQRKTILKLVQAFGDMYGYDKVIFHNERSSKTCPGTSINKDFFIAEAKNYKEIGTVKVNVHGDVREVEGFIKEGTTYIVVDSIVIPLRSTLESLGIDVGWDNKNGVVLIDV